MQHAAKTGTSKEKHEWSEKMSLSTRASQRESAFAAFEFNENGMHKVGAGRVERETGSFR